MHHFISTEIRKKVEKISNNKYWDNSYLFPRMIFIENVQDKYIVSNFISFFWNKIVGFINESSSIHAFNINFGLIVRERHRLQIRKLLGFVSGNSIECIPETAPKRQTSRQIGFTGCWTLRRRCVIGIRWSTSNSIRFLAPLPLLFAPYSDSRPFEIGQARLIDGSPFETPRRDSKRQLRIPGGCEERHKGVRTRHGSVLDVSALRLSHLA